MHSEALVALVLVGAADDDACLISVGTARFGCESDELEAADADTVADETARARA